MPVLQLVYIYKSTIINVTKFFIDLFTLLSTVY